MISKNINRKAVLGAKLIFTPIAFACIFWVAWQSRGVLGGVLSSARWPLLLVSIFAWMSCILLSPFFYMQVFRSCGYSISYKSALKVHVNHLPAKYIPGGIWHTVGRVVELRSLGVDPRSLGIFVFLENFLAPSVTFLFGALILCVIKGWMLWGGGMLVIFLLAGVAIMLGFVLINLKILRGSRKFAFLEYCITVCVVVLFWMAAAVAFGSYMEALSDSLPVPTGMEAVGVYLFSWGAGYLFPFAPQGIGVFEMVAATLVNADTSMSALIAVIAGFRLVVLAADVAAYLLFKFLGNKKIGGVQITV